MDGSDFCGLGFLAIVGFVALGIVTLVTPPLVIWGVAWLAEPRIGVAPFMPWIIAQGIWGAVLTALAVWSSKP